MLQIALFEKYFNVNKKLWTKTQFSLTEINLKILSAIWQPFCIGLNVMNSTMGGHENLYKHIVMEYANTVVWVHQNRDKEGLLKC